MGVYDIKQKITVPGIERLVMNYDQTTGEQVFSIDATEIRMRPQAMEEEICAAILAAFPS